MQIIFVVIDGHNSGNFYKAELVTFGAGAVRNDVDSNHSMILASASGIHAGGSYQLVTFEYTSDGVNDLAIQGHDVALRFVGATNSANIDNIQVAVNGGGAGDTTPPTLTSTDIVDDRTGATVTANTLVTYTVTFSEDMDETTVDAAEFGNADTSTLTVGSVTETSPGVFSVQATPTTGGTLQLQVNAGAVLPDLAGNANVGTNNFVVSVPAARSQNQHQRQTDLEQQDRSQRGNAHHSCGSAWRRPGQRLRPNFRDHPQLVDGVLPKCEHHPDEHRKRSHHHR